MCIPKMFINYAEYLMNVHNFHSPSEKTPLSHVGHMSTRELPPGGKSPKILEYGPLEYRILGWNIWNSLQLEHEHEN